MTVSKNPFRVRASEPATADDQFLSLFGSRIVDMLPSNELWDRLLMIASAPGGGKTTLLRLFTPRVLGRLHAVRASQEFKELTDALEKLSALGSERVEVLGVLVNCDDQYGSVDDLNQYDETARIKLFFSFLESRVTLLALRAACQLAQLQYPRDVALLDFVPRSDSNDPVGKGVSGQEVYATASRIEREVSSALDSLTARRVPTEGKSQLDFLRLLSDHQIEVNGKPICSLVLVMFDDVHRLTKAQRVALRADLQDRRLRVGRWMATRLDALEPQELIGEARTEGREYRECRIEDWWSARAPLGLYGWLRDVANRRARRAEIDVDSFGDCLATSLAQPEEHRRTTLARQKAEMDARSLAKGHEAFKQWVEWIEGQSKTDDAHEVAIKWRALQIMMERRTSRQLPLEIALDDEDLLRGFDAAKAAAELFLAREHNIPYYFGSDAVAQLGSWNVEQYLSLAGSLFDRVIAASIGRSEVPQLSATQQDHVLRQASRNRLNALQQDIPYGRDVWTLVDVVGRLCADVTYRPQASYAPGVTGIAITMRERSQLIDVANRGSDPAMTQLYVALAAAIAHNIFEPRLNRRVKGDMWMVLHLNRLLCPAFRLPLQRANHREIRLHDLRNSLVGIDRSPAKSLVP